MHLSFQGDSKDGFSLKIIYAILILSGVSLLFSFIPPDVCLYFSNQLQESSILDGNFCFETLFRNLYDSFFSCGKAVIFW